MTPSEVLKTIALPPERLVELGLVYTVLRPHLTCDLRKFINLMQDTLGFAANQAENAVLELQLPPAAELHNLGVYLDTCATGVGWTYPEFLEMVLDAERAKRPPAPNTTGQELERFVDSVVAPTGQPPLMTPRDPFAAMYGEPEEEGPPFDATGPAPAAAPAAAETPTWNWAPPTLDPPQQQPQQPQQQPPAAPPATVPPPPAAQPAMASPTTGPAFSSGEAGESPGESGPGRPPGDPYEWIRVGGRVAYSVEDEGVVHQCTVTNRAQRNCMLRADSGAAFLNVDVRYLQEADNQDFDITAPIPKARYDLYAKDLAGTVPVADRAVGQILHTLHEIKVGLADGGTGLLAYEIINSGEGVASKDGPGPCVYYRLEVDGQPVAGAPLGKQIVDLSLNYLGRNYTIRPAMEAAPEKVVKARKAKSGAKASKEAGAAANAPNEGATVPAVSEAVPVAGPGEPALS